MPISFANIAVPFFPEIKYMVRAKGYDPGPWVGKILNIQERSKTVKVLCYMQDEDRPGQGLYIRNCNMRLEHDTISWDSILG